MKNIIRNVVYFIVDLITLFKGINRKINGFNIKFSPKWARYYKDGYEKGTFKFFREHIKKGNTILDLGAHIGLYAVPFAELVGEKGKVFCFEPTPSTYEIMKETIKLNKYKNIKAINAAISDKSGTVIFNLMSENGEGSNANSIIKIGRTKTSVNVQAYCIDDFREIYKLKIDILKIDIEGAELSALKGAKETFEQDRPIGILALHPLNIAESGHTLLEIWDCIQQYNMKIVYNKEIIPKDLFCSQESLFDVELVPY